MSWLHWLKEAWPKQRESSRIVLGLCPRPLAQTCLIVGRSLTWQSNPIWREFSGTLEQDPRCMLWPMSILIGFARTTLDLESMPEMCIDFSLRLSWWLPSMLKTCEFSSPSLILLISFFFFKFFLQSVDTSNPAFSWLKYIFGSYKILYIFSV